MDSNSDLVYYESLLNTIVLNANNVNVSNLVVGNIQDLSLTPLCPLFNDATQNVISQGPMINGQLIIGNTGNLPTIGSLLGTANQIVVTGGAGTVTLSLASPLTFGSVALTNVTNQIVMGTTNTTTINSVAPSASRVVTLPDVGANSRFWLIDTSSQKSLNGPYVYQDGSSNVALGGLALINVSGSNNTAVGSLALTNNITGSHNVSIGSVSMGIVGNPNRCICIGYASNVSSVTSLNRIVIGYSTLGTIDNSVCLGNTLNTLIYSNGSSDLGNSSNRFLGLYLSGVVNTTSTTPINYPLQTASISTLGGVYVGDTVDTENAITIHKTTNQLILGQSSGGQTITINAPAPASSRAYRFLDAGTNANILLSEGPQTINGAQKFTTAIEITPTTNQIALGTAPNVTQISAPASVGAVTLTLPNTTDTIVACNTVDILTNKTIVLPVIASTNASQALTIANVTDSSSSTTGSLIVSGGVGIAKALFVGTTINSAGVINADLVTDSSSVSTGSIICDGGVGIAKKLFVGQTINSAGAINADLVTDSSSSTTGSIICDGGVGIAKALFVGTTINSAGVINADLVTDSSSSTTGSIICDGGVGIAKALFVGTTINSAGAINADLVTDSSSSTTGSIICDGGVGIAKALFVGTTMNSAGVINADLTTDSSSVSTGSIICDGGVGIAKALFVGTTINSAGAINADLVTDSSSVSTGSIICDGGVGIAKKLFVGQTINSAGIINADDTTDSSSSTVGSIVCDGGIGCAKSMFVGGAINAANTSDSTSVSNGSLICSGGCGIAKKLYIGTGAYFPTTGGTASELNFYEEYSASYSFTGPFSVSKTFVITRVGKNVTMTWPAVQGTAGSTADLVSSAGSIPSRFRPTNGLFFTQPSLNLGVVGTGSMTVSSAGTITYWKNGAEASYDSGAGTAGPSASSISWSL